MKPFTVNLVLKPAVRLPNNVGKLELKFPEQNGFTTVIITKIEEETFGNLIQTGLRFKVFLTAENVKEAIHSAKGVADGIVSSMTLSTGRGLEIPREELAYEITPNVKEREFMQIFYDDSMISISRRNLDPEVMNNYIQKFYDLDDPSRERIARAIRWYRLGIFVTDIFDEFNCYWIGLESLNELLQLKLSVEDDPITCPKCKHTWVSTPTVSGIRTFIQQKMSEEKNLYRNIRSLRINIMHSTERLQEIQKEVAKYTPKTGEALFRAICFVLGFEEWNTISRGVIFKEFPIRGEFQGILVGGDPLSLGHNGEDPYFDINYKISDLKFREDETLVYKGGINSTAHLNPYVKFTSPTISVYSPESEATGTITGALIRKSDGTETPI